MADVNDFLVRNTTPKARTSECFTVLGQQDFFDDQKRPRINDENKALAKMVSVDNNPNRYYIKVGTYGKIYNPIGLYSEGQSERFLSKIGRKQFEYKEVNQKVFDMYVSFLSTKNIAWLNNAEREMQ